MSKTEIGGVVVADGSRIRWAALASVFVGSWAYAWFLGVQEFILLVGNGLRAALSRFEAWVAAAVDTLLAGPTDAAALMWASFGRELGQLGPFAFTVAVLATAGTLYILFVGVANRV